MKHFLNGSEKGIKIIAALTTKIIHVLRIGNKKSRNPMYVVVIDLGEKKGFITSVNARKKLKVNNPFMTLPKF